MAIYKFVDASNIKGLQTLVQCNCCSSFKSYYMLVIKVLIMTVCILIPSNI